MNCASSEKAIKQAAAEKAVKQAAAADERARARDLGSQSTAACGRQRRLVLRPQAPHLMTSL